MQRAIAICLAAVALIAAAPAPTSAPALPVHTTDPAQLPKVFAVAIRAADPAKSVRFYCEALGATGDARNEVDPIYHRSAVAANRNLRHLRQHAEGKCCGAGAAAGERQADHDVVGDGLFLEAVLESIGEIVGIAGDVDRFVPDRRTAKQHAARRRYAKKCSNQGHGSPLSRSRIIAEPAMFDQPHGASGARPLHRG